MTVFGKASVDAVTIDRHAFPGTEELRMVCAIARTAVVNAAREGCYNAAFRGFEIHAVRQAQPCGVRVALHMIFSASHRVGVMLIVTGKPGHDEGRHPVGRDVIDQCDTIVVEPIDFLQVL